MRAVFDTNVLVAAFATEGLCATLLRRARKGDFHLLPQYNRKQAHFRIDRSNASGDSVRDAQTLLKALSGSASFAG